MARLPLRCAALPGARIAVLAFTLLTTSCVSKGTYNAAIADAQSARTAAHDTQTQLEAASRQYAYMRSLVDQLTSENVDLQRSVDGKADLEQVVREMSLQLASVRHAKAQADQRAADYRALAQRLQSMVDAGALRVHIRDGRMVLTLPTDVLFDSGSVTIKRPGRDTLTQVAAALKGIEGRHFQVAGHTDNVPIENSRFESNWELSTQRGVEVVKFLVTQGVPPAALSAAGYADVDPVAKNDSPASKARNRRIEITVLPNLDEMPLWPERRP